MEKDNPQYPIKEIENPLLPRISDSMKGSEVSATSSVRSIVVGVSSYRYFATFGYFLLVTSISISLQFFVPILVVLKENYDVPLFYVQMAAVLPQLMYPFSSFLIGSPLLEKIGTTYTFYIGGTLVTICMWLRLLINVHFFWAIVACIFSGLGAPALWNAITVVTLAWFPTKERPLATTLVSLYPAIGKSVGMFLPVIYLNSNVKDASKETIKDNVFKAVLLAAILLTTFIIVGFLLFRQKPRLPPSPEATCVEQRNTWTDFKCLCKNHNFLFFSFNCWILFCVINVIGASIAPIVDPFDDDPTTIAYLLVVFIVCGIVGAVVVGMVISKTRKFKLALYVLQFGTIIGLIEFFLTLDFTESAFGMTFVYIGMGLLGFFVIPLMALYFEFGTEIGYPVGGPSIMGWLDSGIQLMVSGFALLSAYLLDPCKKDKTKIFGIVAVGVIFANLFFTCFVKEDLRLTESAKNMDVLIIEEGSMKEVAAQPTDYGEEDDITKSNLSTL